MTIYYFAYGSNLWTQQIVQRIGHIDRNEGWPRRALLPGYRLLFNMLGEDGNVYANIEANSESSVLGVVYRCTPDALRIMDRYESGYERRQVTVKCQAGERLDVTTYIALADHVTKVATSPTDEYLQRIVTGATEQGLLQSYIREIISNAHES
ncbi:MAG: gamma-glutamylcyclotransferase family protein [Schlesneria sp.]